MFLSPPKPTEPNRQRRRASVGLADFAALVLLGGRLPVGASNSCGLQRAFANCQEQSGAIAKKYICPLSDSEKTLTDCCWVYHKHKRKVSLGGKRVSRFSCYSSRIGRGPRQELGQYLKNIYEQNFLILRDCDQLLFANQQLNISFDTISSPFCHDSCNREKRSFSVVHFLPEPFEFFFCFASNYLPMSLTPVESLLAILDSVSLRQSKAEDCLFLAVQTNDLLS